VDNCGAAVDKEAGGVDEPLRTVDQVAASVG
jgi:hypothetical protein